MIVAGIDPGKTGAMVILFPDNSVIVNRVPLMKLRGKEVPAWREWQQQWDMALESAMPDRIVVEKVGTRPGHGISSSGNFMQFYGFALCMAYRCGSELHAPTPLQWKSKLGLLNSDKNASREAARRLMPRITGDVARVKDDGVAEAALLAWYGRAYL